MPGTPVQRLKGMFSKRIKIESAKEILHSINAKLPPGNVIAILGTSGSGKTTLLNTLAERVKDKNEGVNVKGKAVFRQLEKNTSSLARKLEPDLLGYVLQHDHLLPNLTTRETLTFAGLMKLPSSLRKEQKLVIVEKVLIELGLRDCAETRVGGDGTHPAISGGERRRVSVGIQMLTDPSILFLDEPTTGLDSFTANKLMGTLSEIAHSSRRTIICTVHQPRSDIFQLFDYVMLLSKGKIIYFGKSGDTVIGYFSRIGFTCPIDMNPADFFLDLITVDKRSPAEEKESGGRVAQLVLEYEKTDKTLLCDCFEVGRENNLMAIGNKSEVKQEMKGIRAWKGIDSFQKISIFYQIYLLSFRLLTNLFRDRSLVIAKLIEPLLMGFCIGLIFFQLESDLQGISGSIAALYSSSNLQPYIVMISSMIQYSRELPVFDREYSDKMITAFPYFVAQVLISIPWALVTPLLFCLPFYFMVGLRPGFSYFAWFYAFITSTQYALESFGFLCSCILRDFGPSSLTANSVMTFWNLGCGFLINPATFPFYLTYISYSSPLLYAFSGLAVNQFKDNEYPCPADPTSPICAQFNGNFVINSLNLAVEDQRINLSIIISMCILFRLLGFLILRFYKQPPK